ncbi:MAG: TetR/AcrR family transcriptional regulator [Chloroflexi bacterium]|nr:TetR/AcrR family transcriptional regulator [Chloroflexota bacterium]
MQKPEFDKAFETRQKILDAAVKVFAAKGYHEARVDEIVVESGTSKGAVYFHFPSKQEIFLAVIDKFVALLERNLTEAIDQEEYGIAQVEVALRVCLETFEKYRNLAKILLIQATGLGDAFEEKLMEIHDRFARLIAHHLDLAVSNGEIPPIDTEVAGQVWMGAVYHVVIRWVRTGEPEPVRALPTLRQMLLQSVGILGDATGPSTSVRSPQIGSE